MRFRKSLSFFFLATGLACVLPAWAQAKIVVPGFSPACAEVAASLPRHSGIKPPLRCRGGIKPPLRCRGGIKPFLRHADLNEAFLEEVSAAQSPEPASMNKPLNQVQVFALLAGQAPSHRVTLLVQERGIDFEPTDDYLQEVRLAGGEEELINALKVAKVVKPVPNDPSLQARQTEVRQHVARGAEFFEKGQYADAETEYRAALQLDPQDSDLHVGLSAALTRQKKPDEALAEAHEAVRLNPANDRAHYSLGHAMFIKGDWGEAMAEEREALRLNPDNDRAHANLGAVLGKKGDQDGEIKEEREALRLNPKNDEAHYDLGGALATKGDWDGVIGEEGEAVRLNPMNEDAHSILGEALAEHRRRGRRDRAGARSTAPEPGERSGAFPPGRGAVAEGRSGQSHCGVPRGVAHSTPAMPWHTTTSALRLETWATGMAEITEDREALRLNPKNQDAHISLGAALATKGNLDGAIAEYREALRLNPESEKAHLGLGAALRVKGQWDGAIAEFRQALRLNPNLVNAHLCSWRRAGGQGRCGRGDRGIP